jgi:hypothetical protein
VTVPTETATTAYGEVEYETVACDNCGNEVIDDEAVAGVVGVNVSGGMFGGMEVNRGEPFNLCPHCAEALFGYRKSGYGGIPISWNALVHRLTMTDDPFFAFAFAALGTLTALFVGAVVVGILTDIATMLL